MLDLLQKHVIQFFILTDPNYDSTLFLIGQKKVWLKPKHDTD